MDLIENGLLKDARCPSGTDGGGYVAFGDPHFPSLSTVLSLFGGLGAETPPREDRDLVRRYFLKLSEEDPSSEGR